MASFINSHVTKKGASTATTATSASAAKASTAMKVSFVSAGASMIGGGSAGTLLATSPTSHHVTNSTSTSTHSSKQQLRQDNYRTRSSSFSDVPCCETGTMTTAVMRSPSSTKWMTTSTSVTAPTTTMTLNMGRSATQTPFVAQTNNSSRARDDTSIARHSQKKKQNEALHEFAQKHPTLTARAMVLSTPFNHSASSSVSALVADAACYASVLCAARPMEVSQLFQKHFVPSSKTKQQQMRSFHSRNNTSMQQQKQAPLRSFNSILKSLPNKHQAPTLAFYDSKRIEFTNLHHQRMHLLSRRTKTSSDVCTTTSSEGTKEYDARGLRNPSQMCFVNSVLQALTSLPSMVSYLQSSVWMMAFSEVLSVQSQVVQEENDGNKHSDNKEMSDVLLELLLDLGGVGFQQNLQSNGLEANNRNSFGSSSFERDELQRSYTRSSSAGDRVQIAPSPLNRPVNHDILHTIAQRHTQFRNAHTQAATVGLEQHDAQEFFQALMDYLINEVQQNHLMDVDTSSRIPNASLARQDDHNREVAKEAVMIPSLLQRMQMDSEEIHENPDKNLKFDDNIEPSISTGMDREIETTEIDFKSEDAFLDARTLNYRANLNDLMCDNYSDSAAEEKKSNDDYGYSKYRSEGKEPSLIVSTNGKHVSFQDAGSLPMTHVTTSTSTDTTSNSTEATCTSDLHSDDAASSVGLSSFQETLLNDDDYDPNYTDMTTMTAPFNDETKMLSVLQSTAPSPLSGWLGSCLQCCSCHSFRPILNAPFVDIPVVPTAVTNMLAGGRGASMFARASMACSPSSTTPSCTVKECLSDFTSIERVTEVECRNCALIEAKRKVAEERALLQRGIQSIRSKAMDSSALQEELEYYKKRQKELEQIDLDDDLVWDSSSSSDAVGIDSTNTTIQEDFGLLLSDPTTSTMDGVQNKKIKPLKRDFWKCLLITRLPSVICLHIQRRYFDAAQDRMAKALQHVAFEETLDMAPFCVYAGEKLGCNKDVQKQNSTNTTNHINDQTNTAPYRLMSVVEHRGNAYMGHYVTYRKVVKSSGSDGVKTGKWVRISDETVDVVNWNDVQRAQAYMLFYEAM